MLGQEVWGLDGCGGTGQLIPACRTQRQVDTYEFDTSVISKSSSKPAWARHFKTLSQKQNQTKKKEEVWDYN